MIVSKLLITDVNTGKLNFFSYCYEIHYQM